MKQLFLCASFSEVVNYFEAFMSTSLSGKTVSFIPTACEVETYTAYMDNDRQAFRSVGIEIDELNLSTMSLAEMTEKIKRNDFIFVGGGNTFYLLQALRHTKLDKVLVDAINEGKPYIGTSAGSIVLAPDIAYVESMDDRAKAPLLTNTAALHSVDCYILPHFNNPPFDKITAQIYETYHQKINLIRLSNHQVLAIKNNKSQLIGSLHDR